MKKGKILAVSGFLLISFLSRAQDEYAFRVLANKGANEVKSGDSWQPLKTGAQLKTGDQLKISENASVGLVSNFGRPLEVKEAKTYKAAHLLSKVCTSQSVLSIYTDSILSSNSVQTNKYSLIATRSWRS